jgi:hypothetical protein
MAKLIWGFFIFSTSGIALWIISSSFRPSSRGEFVVVLIFFVVQPLGALWMVADTVRNEQRPLKYVLFSLVPYTFVWYFAQRARWNRIRHVGQSAR